MPCGQHEHDQEHRPDHEWHGSQSSGQHSMVKGCNQSVSPAPIHYDSPPFLHRYSNTFFIN
ncbi:hypothetical protein GBA52_028902 [Prunus armeniaca]|nr:hypothetical protein GBA52_028902 [Prunus armeniaca]